MIATFVAALVLTQAPATPQIVHRFSGPMPTGVTVSQSGRVFVNFPRWGDRVPHSVVELKDGREVPYPNATITRLDRRNPERSFVCVQSVVVDPSDRLWVLDAGAPMMGPTLPGGPKLVGIDLTTNQIVKTIVFPRDVALPTSYLNDVRFDLRKGRAGMAFITDSSDKGPNAMIVVDLDSGRAWRRLNDHPSTKAEPSMVPIVEGEALMERRRGQIPKRLTIGADGIALSPGGDRLYYCPLISRQLYSVSLDALVDPNMAEADVAATVRNEGMKGASDGLIGNSKGGVILTEYERHGVFEWMPDGRRRQLLNVDPAYWPDTLSLAPNGDLYVMLNSLHRQARFHMGRDRRQKPYVLVKMATDARPVALR